MSDESPENEFFELLEALGGDRLDPTGHERLQRLLREDPEARRTYLDYIDLHLGLRRLVRGGRGMPATLPPSRSGLPARRAPRFVSRTALGVAAAALLAISIALLARSRRELAEPAGGPAIARDVSPVLAQSSGARFFGGRALSGGSPLALGQDYALSDGQVEIRFADGATAIIQAPAVFVAAGRARLVMKLGRCSVHAPEGAEGFRVETSVAQVVDLGTRFFVEVSEASGTDVHVVDGAAEVYPCAAPAPRNEASRLTTGQACRYAIRREGGSEPIAFDASRYTSRLPDRVVAYSASERKGLGVEELRSITVQRGGRLHSYSTTELIGVDLIHFCARGGGSFITTPTGTVDLDRRRSDSRERAALLDRDTNLNTGVINPGGARVALTGSPVLHDPERPGEPNTPGFAVRFHEPVINSAGPDVVFFELQVIVHPEKGDPFHVSPLRFEPGLKSHTIHAFDIDLSSPEARPLAGFRLYAFETRVRSLSDLLGGRHNGGSEHLVGAKALAVGIDLSDLGYPPGAAVDGLFFQDAYDDNNLVDPVFIAALPPETPPRAGDSDR